MATPLSLTKPSFLNAQPSPCPRCGQATHVGEGAISSAAQERICELESRVTELTTKASTAVYKIADYEDELSRLKSRLAKTSESQNVVPRKPVPEQSEQFASASQRSSNAGAQSVAGISEPDAAQSGNAAAQGRFTSFLTRKASDRAPSRREGDLEAALAREQSLRQQAEGRLTEVNGELEELSAQLFEQANDMVAVERRARAKLEERVKVLERRDVEKRKRLERLEEALKRIERARRVLQNG